MIFAQFCTNCTGSFRRTDLEKGSNRFLDHLAEIFRSKILSFHSLLLKGKKIQFHYDFSRFFKKKFRFFQFFSKEFWDRFPFSRLFFLKKRISLFNIKNCDETFTKENSTNFCENLLKQRIFTKII